MPLSEKGRKILTAMRKQYGSEKKAESVFYASKNSGRISGVDQSMSGTLPTNAQETTPSIDTDRQVVPSLRGTDERRFTIGQIRSGLTADRAAGFPKLRKALGR